MPSSATSSAELGAWAASGAMALTGRRDGPPLGPPAGFVGAVTGIATRLGIGGADALALLGERAAITGHERGGTTSCGGATRLLATADGWIALSLARPDDHDLLPAWLGVEGGADDVWEAVGAAVAARTTADLLEAATGLGLPLGALPTEIPSPAPDGDLPVTWTPVAGTVPQPTSLDGCRVVDLTSLWAGPLCGSLLADLGADVVKVESTRRPDGSRSGPLALFDLLNARKRSVALDLSSRAGHAALSALLADADIVLEGSRPRALRSMGIDAPDLTAMGPRVWVSITGHGRDGDAGDRVGFGDDAAVEGGLVAWEDGEPRFCADAVADPLTGLVAAAAVVEALDRGGRWIVGASLAGVSRHLAGPTLAVPASFAADEVRPPRARPSRGHAPELGAHSRAVLGIAS